MMNLRDDLLRDDPLAFERDLDPEEVEQIRHRVVAQTLAVPREPNRVFVAVAAALLLAAMSGVLISRLGRTPRLSSGNDIQSGDNTRQFQFVGADGTRLIWTFNPNLDLR